MNVIRMLGLFIVAGLFEIGGVYLIWQWVRADKSALWGILGLIALLVYGLIQTLQVFTFGRAFAAYGGIFITVAMLWAWKVDSRVPDHWDWLEWACVCSVHPLFYGVHALDFISVTRERFRYSMT